MFYSDGTRVQGQDEFTLSNGDTIEATDYTVDTFTSDKLAVDCDGEAVYPFPPLIDDDDNYYPQD